MFQNPWICQRFHFCSRPCSEFRDCFFISTPAGQHRFAWNILSCFHVVALWIVLRFPQVPRDRRENARRNWTYIQWQIRLKEFLCKNKLQQFRVRFVYFKYFHCDKSGRCWSSPKPFSFLLGVTYNNYSNVYTQNSILLYELNSFVKVIQYLRLILLR